MAFVQCDFFSQALGLCTSINVVLPLQPVPAERHKPDDAPFKGGRPRFPVLYLLHGLSDDHTIWMRRTSIERYAEAMGLAVVMPAGHRAYYTDQVDGYAYATHIMDEVPAVARQLFPISDRREENFVAGLSMGGYGALKWGLTRPHTVAAAASLSGAVNIASVVEYFKQGDEDRTREFTRTFGPLDQIPGSDNDLIHLMDKAKTRLTDLPALYACCGTEDFLYPGNQTFLAAARQRGLPITYEEGPGAHNWAFWDQWIQRVLNWLPVPRQEAM